MLLGVGVQSEASPPRPGATDPEGFAGGWGTRQCGFCQGHGSGLQVADCLRAKVSPRGDRVWEGARGRSRRDVRPPRRRDRPRARGAHPWEASGTGGSVNLR